MSSRDQLLEEIRKVASSQTPFEVGKYLHTLSRQLSKQKDGVSIHDLIRQAHVRGRNAAKLHTFLRLYRIYRDYPLEQMKRLSDGQACILGNEVCNGKRVFADTELDEANFRMDPANALTMALSGRHSPKGLAALIREGGKRSGFANETEIENWFATKEDFLVAHKLTLIARQAAPGRASGDIDFVAERVDNLGNLVLLELKDVATSESIGRVLGQKNELLELSDNGVVYLYPEYKNSPRKFSKSNSKEIPFTTVETWIIASMFRKSAFYAAKGQDIFLFKITSNMQIVGPCHARNMTQQQWLELNREKSDNIA